MSATVDQEVAALAATQEAASIVCHRLSQYGWDSHQASNAHESWRKAWLRWAAIHDERHGGETKL